MGWEGCQERILGEMTGTGGHLRSNTETQCSGNSLESTGVLMKPPSNGGFGAQSGHLLYPGKAPSSGTRTSSAQPQSLHTAILKDVLGQWWHRTCKSVQSMTGTTCGPRHEREPTSDTAWMARS